MTGDIKAVYPILNYP